MGGGAGEGGDDPENPDGIPKQASGMSQSVQNDIGVCVVIILITVLAIIVTTIKIILFDRQAYPELFGIETTTSTTSTANPLL